MSEKKKVLLGMSGGVDSAVSAILLREQGYDVVGVTMELFCKAENDTTAEDAKKVCDFLEIPHHVVHFENEFKKYVIDDFICQYKKCRTPNPCIECNKYLKFGAMYEMAKTLDCEYIATGHYAKVEFDERYGKHVIKKSKAGKKDQSYVLYNIDKEIVDKILIPLSEFTSKDEIREIAKEYNLPVASKKDSEDICFIPDGDYKKFLEENSDIKAKEGNIVDKNGNVLGRHSGLYKYTIGQRKGLGIAHKTPLFVLGFNPEKNELIVGEESELYVKEFYVSNVNLLLVDAIEDEMKVEVKTRYSSKAARAVILKDEDKLKVIFEEPQKSITPGQSAVFYIDDVVLGGGKIL